MILELWDTYSMELQTVYNGAIKMDGRGSVKGYLIRFGDSKTTDLEGDYFTAQTDYGFKIAHGEKVPLNLYYHHGLDQMVGKKSIGSGYIKMDHAGLWYEAQIDMADEYGKMIADLVKRGKMGYSSGAAGHMVERKSVEGVQEIIRWPIAEASLTPTPAEYRNAVKGLQDYYEMADDVMIMDDDYMQNQYNAPVLPVPGEPLDEFARMAFDKAEHEIVHKGLEAYYEVLMVGLSSAPDEATAAALVDEFAARAKGVHAMHGMKAAPVESLRATERRLRDVIGLSRAAAKRLAPTVWDQLRDAGQQPEIEITETLQPIKTAYDRAQLLERIGLLLQL